MPFSIRYINEMNVSTEDDTTDSKSDSVFGEEHENEALIKAREKEELQFLLSSWEVRRPSHLSLRKKKVLLFAAVDTGHTAVVADLLSEISDPSAGYARKVSPLHMAVRKGNREVVKMLVQAGHNKNPEDREKETPLHYAVEKTNFTATDLEIVKDLVEGKANLRARNTEGQTPFHVAAAVGNVNAVDALLELDENSEELVNMADKRGYTPLHATAESLKTRNSATIIELLLEHGADPNKKDIEGRTPLHCLIDKKISKINKDLTLECVEIFMLHDKFELSITDNKGLNALSTLLHLTDNEADYSVYKNTSEIIDMLVYKGSPVNDWYSLYQMIQLFPSFVTAVLDNSITCNKHSTDSPNFKLDFDVSPIVFPKESDTSYSFEKANPHFMPRSETSLLFLMVGMGKKRSRILLHPLCRFFIHAKWHKVQAFVVFNVLFHLIFASFTSAYLFHSRTEHPHDFESSQLLINTHFGDHNKSKDFDKEKMDTEEHIKLSTTNTHYLIYNNSSIVFTLKLLFIACWFFLLGREIVEMLHNPFIYLDYGGNYVDMLLILLSFLVLYKDHWTGTLGAITITVTWIRVLMAFGYLDFAGNGVYVAMFTTVTRNILKFLSAYIFIPLAFTFGFMTILRNDEAFQNVWISSVTVLVMMTGELDYREVFLGRNSEMPGFWLIIIVLFIFFVYLILSNLLVGMAVHDLQAVQRRAELIRLTHQVQMIFQVEILATSNLIFPFFRSFFKRILYVREYCEKAQFAHQSSGERNCSKCNFRIYPNMKRHKLDRLLNYIAAIFYENRCIVSLLQRINPRFSPYIMAPKEVLEEANNIVKDHEDFKMLKALSRKIEANPFFCEMAPSTPGSSQCQYCRGSGMRRGRRQSPGFRVNDPVGIYSHYCVKPYVTRRFSSDCLRRRNSMRLPSDSSY